jgi:hypothetical protein
MLTRVRVIIPWLTLREVPVEVEIVSSIAFPACGPLLTTW